MAYWGDQRKKYDLKSTTKSFGSIITALAFKDKRIDREARVQPILPELGVPQSTSQKKSWLPEIQVKHLLTHTAGFGKVGGVTDLQFRPGTAWLYSDGGTNWLADLMTVLYHQDLLNVLRSRVLTPLGIPADRLNWRRNLYRSDHLRGIVRREFGSGISTDVDVMARIGLLLLRDGRWKNTQILLADDVDRATTHRPWLSGLRCIDVEPCEGPLPTEGYGFLFWTNTDGQYPSMPRDAFFSYGLYDSFILVMPHAGNRRGSSGASLERGERSVLQYGGRGRELTCFRSVAAPGVGAPITACRIPDTSGRYAAPLRQTLPWGRSRAG